MKNCSACKYWSSKSEDHKYENDDVRLCSKIKMPHNSGNWSSRQEGMSWETKKGQLAMVQDASDYSAYLISYGNFGCVMHEEKK